MSEFKRLVDERGLDPAVSRLLRADHDLARAPDIAGVMWPGLVAKIGAGAATIGAATIGAKVSAGATGAGGAPAALVAGAGTAKTGVVAGLTFKLAIVALASVGVVGGSVAAFIAPTQSAAHLVAPGASAPGVRSPARGPATQPAAPGAVQAAAPSRGDGTDLAKPRWTSPRALPRRARPPFP